MSAPQVAAMMLIIDGGLTKVGPEIVGWFGSRVRRIQNGDIQRYIIMVVLGAASILFFATFWLPYRGIQGVVTTDGRKVTLKLGEGKVPPGRLVYRIDWDGDGKFDQEKERQADKGFFHEYPAAGQYHIVVEAHDPVWHVGKSSSDWFLGSRTPLVVKVGDGANPESKSDAKAGAK